MATAKAKARTRTPQQLARHREQMKRYRAASVGVSCTRCGAPVVGKLRRCELCLAQDTERRHPDMRHDTRAHAMLIFKAHQVDARCSATGYTLRELRKAGMHLEVDRRDSDRGYTAANMQVVASYLNRMKGRHASWPDFAVHELHERVRLAGVLDAEGETRAWMPAGAF